MRYLMLMLSVSLGFSTGCVRTKTVTRSCVVLDAPEYPQGEWEMCLHETGQTFPCLNLENARELGLYLAAVKRYHESIKQTCGE